MTNKGEKTEFEKMVSGEEYCAWDPDICRRRNKAHSLCNKINKCDVEDEAEKVKLVAELFENDDPTLYVEQPFHCDYGTNIKVGKNVYFNFNATILDGGYVTIGSDTKFGPNCSLYTACHPTEPNARRAKVEFTKPITIGENCWFGGNCTVIPGVTIGNNVVIGAGSVVVYDLPDNVVAVGNPCHVVKEVPKAN
ncbi:thiogalactoside transacetylase, putative [Trichomonas vaginalis G3]|uniref:Thiogalactoside transacetylase, putative n=1 Tax=Trichomonas vaginalis (strain ATCC PRA-98 / G3) TaxID=412133 RepID=A2EWE6_TRIV3|nr:serine O-acetyltransferase protein [Trichomonas vaginalis G3]EAY03050.1 thiogalactoside transacetylase, putative [Trichomonas vaginalis G3]KAI5531474.1 serine O-acetyltransferase protein [Trichomonas vaginalis G3]|eukprot:XP_001315273.1 thiogalactoside transacetylase [Trichomonas vaginalis G3]